MFRDMFRILINAYFCIWCSSAYCIHIWLYTRPACKIRDILWYEYVPIHLYSKHLEQWKQAVTTGTRPNVQDLEPPSATIGESQSSTTQTYHLISGWNLKITYLQRKIIFQTIIFRFYMFILWGVFFWLPTDPYNKKSSKRSFGWLFFNHRSSGAFEKEAQPGASKKEISKVTFITHLWRNLPRILR